MRHVPLSSILSSAGSFSAASALPLWRSSRSLAHTFSSFSMPASRRVAHAFHGVLFTLAGESHERRQSSEKQRGKEKKREKEKNLYISVARQRENVVPLTSAARRLANADDSFQMLPAVTR